MSKTSRKGQYKIHVTREDIDQAIQNDSYHCAVATAVKRQVPDASIVQADIQTIRFSLPSERRRVVYLTPSAVQQYIVEFDAGDPIEPFSFILYRPAWEQEMAVHHQGKQLSSGTAQAVVMSEGTKVVSRVRAHHVPHIGARTERTYGMHRMRVNQKDSKSSSGQPY